MGQIALDTEFMREKTYRAKLCLVQVAVGDSIDLIDATTRVDLKPIAELLADPEVQILVHAGRQDLEIFFERFGVVPVRVFDVQVAAAFAGYGASLPYGRLVSALTGKQLVKGESYSEWCRRPLTKEQLSYAAADVAYLDRVATRLKEELDAQGHLRWAEEEMAPFEDPLAYEIDLDEVYLKVSGRGTLSGRQLAVLRAVARWREETAQQRDVPRGWVVKDPTLIEIARRSPKSIDALKRLRGMNATEAERSGRAILDAIESAHGAPEVAAPRAPSRGAQVRARLLSGPADAVVRARCEAEGVATELVSTRGELEALLADVTMGRNDLSRHRIMQGWRRALAGDHVIAFARGEVAVKATDQPPYIEEIDI